MPEIAACAERAAGVEAEFNFVPHSGPFARGIHVTVQASLKRRVEHRRGHRGARRVLRNCPFVRVIDTPPRVKDVATSNYAHLSAVSNGNSIAVMAVLDNSTRAPPAAACNG